MQLRLQDHTDEERLEPEEPFEAFDGRGVIAVFGGIAPSALLAMQGLRACGMPPRL